MVATAQGGPNANERGVGLLAGEVRRDLPWGHNLSIALRSTELLNRQAEVLGDGGDHLLWLKDALRVRIDSLVQYARCELHRDRHAAESANSDKSRQCAFKLAHVALHAARNLFNNIVCNDDATLFRLGAQDCNARLKIWRRDVGDEAPLKSRAKALLEQRDLFRCAIRRQHNLLPGGVQRVEGVEELFLRALLIGEELNVINEQHIDLAEARTECLCATLLNAGDELIRERFACDVEHLALR